MTAFLAQYRLMLIGLGLAALIALSAAGAWQWQANAYGKQLATQQALHADTLAEIARAAAQQLRDQAEKRAALEQRLASLDSQKHKELTDAQDENDRLRRLYSGADDERKRLRIEVRVAEADRRVSATTGSVSLGNGASFELSERAGSAVWDIRGAMKIDLAKLAYLQGYVCTIKPEFAGCSKRERDPAPATEE